MRELILFNLIILLAIPGCRSIQDGEGENLPTTDDFDRDGISDFNEGRSDKIDTDGDDVPDYMDEDSDQDGLDDALESGTHGDSTRDPRDSDFDGIPDFRDLDSDENGIPDIIEELDDFDGDGLLDYCDPDDDGDNIRDVIEIGDSPTYPNDFDEDGVPDYHDLDSDNDRIRDQHELEEDTDSDGVPDRFDDDSDNDGIPDIEEAGDDDSETPPLESDDDFIPDFRDLDSDSDGLTDSLEYLNQHSAGTDYRNADSDGDGVSDMIEWAAHTRVDDPTDNPRARGDFVFILPYEETPSPPEDTLNFSTSIQIADVYFLVDLTGSMTEISVIRQRLYEIIDRVSCADFEDPSDTGCIPDLALGFGWFTESDTSADTDGISSYTNVINLTTDYDAVQAAIPGSTTDGGYESQRKAIYCAAHGPEGSCPSDAQTYDLFPCPVGHVGYPCFRPNASRILVAVTDEGMDEDSSPDYDVVGAALEESSIHFVGIDAESYGSTEVQDDLRSVARSSGQSPGNELVFLGDDSQIVDAVGDAIYTVAQVPLDVSAYPKDDLSDSVDALDFISSFEVHTDGESGCSLWSNVVDTDGDGLLDQFVQLAPGTPVCWDIEIVSNTFLEPTDEPQMFRATIDVLGGPSETLLDSRNIYFLVPPDFYDPLI